MAPAEAGRQPVESRAGEATAGGSPCPAGPDKPLPTAGVSGSGRCWPKLQLPWNFMAKPGDIRALP